MAVVAAVSVSVGGRFMRRPAYRRTPGIRQVADSLDTISIAVVIPAYRAATTLDTTLASVLVGQSRAPEEVVVVDDGSWEDAPEDRTSAVAEVWAERAPATTAVRLIRQRNAGPAAARRVGVAATSADLLAFVDADDVWLPQHLGLAESVHARYGGLVSPDAVTWRPGHALPTSTRRRRFPVPALPDQACEIVRENFVFSSVLVSRSDYEAAGGFRDGVTGAEDWDLWIRLVRSGVAVRGTDRATWWYRVNPGGLTERSEMLATYEEVLRRVLVESTDRDERLAAEAHLSRLRARRALGRAYEAASDATVPDARAEARIALDTAIRHSGVRPSRTLLEASALWIAPRLGAAAGGAARSRWREARR